MLVFAVRVFCIGTLFVAPAFSQTQAPPTTQASPSPSPSPIKAKHGATPANIWQQRVEEAIHPKKTSSAGGNMEILSDTMGVDFGPYMSRLKESVQKHWYSLIPESARPPEMKSGTTVVNFAVMLDGRVENIKVEQSAGDIALDQAAYGALLDSSPLAHLPPGFSGGVLRIRARFLYNPVKQQSNSKERDTPDEKKTNSDNATWKAPKDSRHL